MNIKSIKVSIMSLKSKDVYTSHLNVINNNITFNYEGFINCFADMIKEAAFKSKDINYTHIGVFISSLDDSIISSALSVEDFNIVKSSSINFYEDILHIMFTKQTIKALEAI